MFRAKPRAGVRLAPDLPTERLLDKRQKARVASLESRKPADLAGLPNAAEVDEWCHAAKQP